jgi:predicted Fe-Mo cluster-binding NifX family protein
MRVCIPIAKGLGLESRVSPHFGSAPLFMLVDPETRAFRILDGARGRWQST